MSSADGSLQAEWAPDQQKILLMVQPPNQQHGARGEQVTRFQHPSFSAAQELVQMFDTAHWRSKHWQWNRNQQGNRGNCKTKSIDGWWPDFGWLPHTMVSLWNQVFLSDITENCTKISSPSSKDAIQMDLECLRGQGSQPAGQWGGREDGEVWHRDRPDHHLPSSSGVQRFLLSFWSSRKKRH